jgi:putative tricarboxylic transport membrane protein
MDILTNLGIGFSAALLPINIGYCFIGVLIGTIIGVLPGIGPTATIAMLLPLTFSLPPVSSLIMLSGIYYGAQYGGSTTSILVKIPGEAGSVMTTIDGYEMAKRGRAGPALAISALGSFFAGTVATIVIVLFAQPLTKLALEFGPTEYFSLLVLGLASSVILVGTSLFKAIGMVVVGLLFGLVGTDLYTGMTRFTLGIDELYDGMNFVALAIGLFGISDILHNLANESTRRTLANTVSHIWPTREDFRRSVGPVLRGTGFGVVLGLLPGGGAVLSSFAAYMFEKKYSKNSSEFGKGAIEGVAAPESANNAGAQTSFIPMLTLGIPSNPVMALMIGALILQGIAPGPNVATQRPDLFWGVIVSMWVGNLFLVILNLPLVGMWVKFLKLPYFVLFPAIMAFCCIGVYSVEKSSFAVGQITVFGLIGYIFTKLDCEPAPMMLGFILGPMLEDHFRRAMLMSRGDPMVFLASPISAGLLITATIMLVIVLIPRIAQKRAKVFHED